MSGLVNQVSQFLFVIVHSSVLHQVNHIPRAYYGLSPVPLLRGAGPSVVLRKALEQTWWTKLFFGLRCDLEQLPPIRRAKIEITMEPFDCRTFSGFVEELKQVKGSDYIEAYLRKALCDAGVQNLHVALGPDRTPAYAQWLVTPENQVWLHAYQPGRYLTLKPGEALVEGAYTFCRFRGVGAMADGMGQLLRVAKNQGSQRVFTYVAADNIPSLRGCANVGFVLDHIRLNKRRLGLRYSVVQGIDEHARELWAAATSPRPSV